EEIVGSRAHDLRDDRKIRFASDHDHRDIGLTRVDLVEKLDAAATGQVDIYDGNVEAATTNQKRTREVGCRKDFVAGALQELGQGQTKAGFVIYQQDPKHTDAPPGRRS